MSAHIAQVPHPPGKALTSSHDATKELSFLGGLQMKHWHCSLKVAKAAAVEAESAGKKNIHLPSG